MTQRLFIDSLGHRGDGVAHTPDGPLYVPHTLPGETVEVQREGTKDRAHLLAVVAGSADRVAPPCPHFGICGGCALQHWRAEPYLAWKRDLVVGALRDAGLDAPVEALVDAHGRGRRRVVFHARRGTHDVLSVGFAAARAHHVIPITQCPVLDPALDRALPVAWAIAEALDPARKPLDIQITASDGGLDVDVRGAGPAAEAHRADLVAIAAAHDLARLTLHGDLVARRRPPTLAMGKASVELPPGAFLQATEAGEAALATAVLAMVGKAKSVVDLFAGVGTFALRLAAQARTFAVDGDAAAIGALGRAARATAGLKPVETQVRDLFRRPLVAKELSSFEAAVFDPPRQGAGSQALRLAGSDVPVVVAVSCNPATFARDAASLVAGGYRLERVVPVDQFRYSAHVEVVARFAR